MKIIQFSGSDTKGGAAKVAAENHRQLLELGVDATLFVCDRANEAAGVELLDPTLFTPTSRFATWRKNRRATYALGPDSRFPKNLGEAFFDGFDLLHLHDVSHFNLRHLPWLTDQIPVIWTLHSMAPFTGNCIYSYGCEGYRERCLDCPQIGKFPLSWHLRDSSAEILKTRRQMCSESSRLYPVGVSNWISDRAAEGVVFAGREVRTVRNGIDTAAFTPIDKREAKERVGIPPEARAILFSVASHPDDVRKGTDIIGEALRIPGLEDVWLIPLGIAAAPEDNPHLKGLPNPTLSPRHLETEEELGLHYSAADIVWHPSRADTSSLVAMEAAACGTPVVAAAVGGVPEVVADGINGILIDPESPEQLHRATRTLLDDSTEYARLAGAARPHAVEQHAGGRMAADYLDLYRELLGTS